MKKELALNKKTGQVVLEALVIFPIVSTCFILCFFLFYVHAQHLWIDHQLYQSLICLSKENPQFYCKKQMKKKIKNFLWTGKLNNIQFKKGANEWTGNFIWETGFWKIRFRKKLIILKGDSL